MTYAATAARGLGDQAEDLDAVNRYIMGTTTVTEKARRLKDEWLLWYDDLSWWEKNYDSNVWDVARNKRNAFNLANTLSSAEKARVEQVIKTGMTTEEMEGRTKRMTSEGKFPEREEPLVPTSYKIGGAVALAGGLYVYFKLVRPAVKAWKGLRGR